MYIFLGGLNQKIHDITVHLIILTQLSIVAKPFMLFEIQHIILLHLMQMDEFYPVNLLKK